MKATIVLVFERDPTSWAQKRQISQTEALADFAGEVRTAAQDGTIADALGRSWPAMRGHISAHPVDGLDDSTRDELLRLLQRSRGAAQDAALIAEIRQHLAEHWQDMDGRDPRWVVFGTVEWDNGYFLAGTEATVHFEDGDHMPYTFEGSRVDDLLTAAYGARGRTAALGVDLRDATLEFSDYGENVLDALDILTQRAQRR
ncbi:hypothetical protein WEI85_19815 [Actinomycetes bacterium KLBMP 9797]